MTTRSPSFVSSWLSRRTSGADPGPFPGAARRKTVSGASRAAASLAGCRTQGTHRPGAVSLLRADLAPLRAARDFRLLYVSRTVTLFGTTAADVALLVQARQLTGSAFDVGLLGAAELGPLVVCGLYGGVLADRVDRSRLLRLCEAGLGCCAGLLVINALQPRRPSGCCT